MVVNMLSPEALDKPVHQLMAEHFATHEDFSETTLNKVRNTIPQAKLPHTPFLQQYILDPEPITDPSAFLDNPIHPIFKAKNWIIPPYAIRTDYTHLIPALQLASQLITNDRALQWFAHVRFSECIQSGAGPKLLVRQDGPITPAMLHLVKSELEFLAGIVKFSWIGSLKESFGAVTCPAPMLVAQTLHDSGLPQSAYPAWTKRWSPTILCNVEDLHTAMRRGRTLAHEMAHVWTGWCFDWACFGVEPLVFPTDEFPESGFSFETFIFGSEINTYSANGIDDVLLSTSLGSVRCEPRYTLGVFIRQRWVAQWFLKATWDNFSELHERGALLAPSAEYGVTDHFIISRWCCTDQTFYAVVCHQGFLRLPFCNNPDCVGLEPGTQQSWPSDLREFLDMYFEVIKLDNAIAEKAGVQRFRPSEGLYDKAIRLMEVGERRLARRDSGLALGEGVAGWFLGSRGWSEEQVASRTCLSATDDGSTGTGCK
jgi:hypothetical protein